MDTLLTNLNNCVKLEELDFSNCDLTGDCIISVSLYMVRAKSLRSIELQGNKIDNQGCRCLAYGLQNCGVRHLSHLGLARNPITEAGAIELGAGIFYGPPVLSLNLSGCVVGGFGCNRVAQIVGMHSNKAEKIDISCVRFSEAAGDELVQMVEKNFSVLQLDCRGCGLTEEQEFKVRLSVERNRYYAANPCVKKTHFSLRDVQEAEAWMARVK